MRREWRERTSTFTCAHEMDRATAAAAATATAAAATAAAAAAAARDAAQKDIKTGPWLEAMAEAARLEAEAARLKAEAARLRRAPPATKAARLEAEARDLGKNVAMEYASGVLLREAHKARKRLAGGGGAGAAVAPVSLSLDKIVGLIDSEKIRLAQKAKHQFTGTKDDELFSRIEDAAKAQGMDISQWLTVQQNRSTLPPRKSSFKL